MKGLEKECVLDEIFNYILTVDRYFYDLEWKAKRQYISREYAVCQRKCVTLRMATLYTILILFVGFALSCNLWVQSRLYLCHRKGGKR